MNTKELISSIWNSWEWHFIWDWNRLKARIRCDCSGWLMMAGEVSEKYRRITVAFLFIVRTDLPWNHKTLSGNTAKSLSTPVERDRPKCDHEKQHVDMFVSRLSRRTFYCWLSIMSAWTEWVNRRTHWQFNCSLLKTIGTHRSQKQKDEHDGPFSLPMRQTQLRGQFPFKFDGVVTPVVIHRWNHCLWDLNWTLKWTPSPTILQVSHLGVNCAQTPSCELL